MKLTKRQAEVLEGFKKHGSATFADQTTVRFADGTLAHNTVLWSLTKLGLIRREGDTFLLNNNVRNQ